MPIEVVGLAWYRKEDYERLMAMFKDREKLPDTYEDWLAKAQNVILTLSASGLLRVEKSYIDPETFPPWCVKRGLEMDASARTRYAAELVQAKYAARSKGKLTL